jgi:hypothetical protein
MKHFILILLGILFCSPALLAQRGERIESIKIAFLANKLNLDPKTAESFWPVYNQYEEELQQLVSEKRRMNQQDSRSADDILDQEQRAIDIKRKYNTQFSKIIGAEQTLKLFQAEREFRHMLIKRRNQQMNDGTIRRNQFTRPERSIESRPPARMQPPPSSAPSPRQDMMHRNQGIMPPERPSHEVKPESRNR